MKQCASPPRSLSGPWGVGTLRSNRFATLAAAALQTRTIAEVMANVRRGAARTGRALPADFHAAALVNVLMLEPGESLTSARVIEESGPAVMTNLHYLVDWVRETGNDPPS